MRIALWIVQVLVALAVLGAGLMKITTPYPDLAQAMAWAAASPAWLVKFIGVAEVAGALGLILPAATRIKPVLTPIAASLLVVVFVLAAGTHLALGEPDQLVAPLLFLVLNAFIAWGRFKVAPIEERGLETTTAAAHA